MKELSIEEKAKAYDERFEKAQKWYDINTNKGYRSIFEDIFPELKESENIRIIKAIKYGLDYVFTNNTTIYETTKEQCLFWLEKQGKKKSIWHNEDEEPQRGSLILLIMQSGNPIVAKIIEPNHTFNHGERWAYIDDLLDKQGEQPVDKIEPKFKVGDRVIGVVSGMPYFITKVCDDHYNTESGCIIMFCAQDNFELYEQKPAMIQWKGDNLKEVIGFTGKAPQFGEWFKTWKEYEEYVHSHNNIFKLFNEDSSHYEVPVGAWIVKTPDGYNVASKAVLKQKPAWSEEDEEIRRKCIRAMRASACGFPEEEKFVKQVDNWFNSLKDRVQPKQEWSEEDEKVLHAIRNALNYEKPRNYLKSRDFEFTDILDWLKSLKDRYTWKPSDEQMLAISTAINVLGKGTINGQYLIELQEQLLKLREE